MSYHAAGYIFSKTGKQFANVLHLHNLASDEEHDTNRGVPTETQRNKNVDQVYCIKFLTNQTFSFFLCLSRNSQELHCTSAIPI